MTERDKLIEEIDKMFREFGSRNMFALEVTK